MTAILEALDQIGKSTGLPGMALAVVLYIFVMIITKSLKTQTTSGTGILRLIIHWTSTIVVLAIVAGVILALFPKPIPEPTPAPVALAKCTDFMALGNNDQVVACNDKTLEGYFWKRVRKIAPSTTEGYDAAPGAKATECGPQSLGADAQAYRYPPRNPTFGGVLSLFSKKGVDHPPTFRCTSDNVPDVGQVEYCGLFLFKCEKQPPPIPTPK